MRQLYSIPSPGAASAQFSLSFRSELRAVTFDVTTDANVGNRRYRFIAMDQQSNVKWSAVVGGDIAASSSAHVTLAFGIDSYGQGPVGNRCVGGGIPQNAVIEVEDRFRIEDVNGIAAGDRITLIRLLVDPDSPELDY